MFMKIFCRYWHHYLFSTIYIHDTLLKKVKSTNLGLKILWCRTLLHQIKWVDFCQRLADVNASPHKARNLLLWATYKVKLFWKIQHNNWNKSSQLFQRNEKKTQEQKFLIYIFWCLFILRYTLFSNICFLVDFSHEVAMFYFLDK